MQLTGVTGPHSFDAVTPVEQDGSGIGLHPNAPPVGTPANTGAVTTVQVMVAEHVLVSPHAVAVQVKVRVCVHPDTTSALEQVTGTLPHSLVAVTV